MTKTKEIKILMVLLVIAVALTFMQSPYNAFGLVDEYTDNTICIFEAIPETTIEEDEETELSDEVFEELKDRCKLIYTLCNEESEETQTAIMATVLNREESSAYPNTFYEVIETFDILKDVWKRDAKKLNFDEIPHETNCVIRDVLNGNDPTEWLLRDEAIRLNLDLEEYAEGGALYFCNLDDCSQQQLDSIKVKATIGNYIFYKK